MTISTVTMDVIGTISLSLTPANGYELNAEGLGPGARTYRRDTITSPFCRGRWVIDAQLDTMSAPLSVLVMGDTAAQLEARLGTLLAAFDQRTYTLQVVIDGITHQWLCEPADSSLGTDGIFDFWDLAAYQQVVHLIVPRDPLPLAGNI